MIGYYGKWGSGKTLSLVANVHRRWLKNPRLVVFTNLPLFFGKHPKAGTELIQHQYCDIMDLRPFFIYAIEQRHDVLAHETIVIIDEASVVLSSRTFASIPTFMISFLAQGRHLNTDFIFTTQSVQRVEKIVRELTENWIYCYRIPLVGCIVRTIENIATDGRILSRHHDSVLFRPWRYFKRYNTYHIVNFGEHQVRDSEKKVETPLVLSEFLDRAYSDTIFTVKPDKSIKKGIGMFTRLANNVRHFLVRKSGHLTKESIIVKIRDDIFANRVLI